MHHIIIIFKNVTKNIINYLYYLFLEEYNNIILWYPIWFILGISLYIIIPFEPSYIYSIVISITIVITAIVFDKIIFTHLLLIKFISRMICIACIGFIITVIKVNNIKDNALYNKVIRLSGNIVKIDHITSDNRLFQKILLSDVIYQYQDRDILYTKDINIIIKTDDTPLSDGMYINLKAIFLAPKKASFPYAYDYEMHSFFSTTGMFGYSVSKIDIINNNNTNRINKLRTFISREIHARLPLDISSIACALVTGDKSSISKTIKEDFAKSGLAHILSISGLHMTLLFGICFIIFFRGLAWIKNLPLYVNLHRIAIIIALIIGYLYLQISGSGIPTKRAFIMILFSAFATFISRRAISNRAIAFAAIIILFFDPFAVYSISFQLSFATVYGLISFYSYLKNKIRNNIDVILFNIFGSTIIATISTIPFMMYYFHNISLQSIVSNVIAIPVTSIFIMPLGLLSIFFLIIGGVDFIFYLWSISIKILIIIAKLCNSYLSFLVFHIPPYSICFFSIAIVGGLIICTFQNNLRYIGIIPFILGIVIPMFGKNPLYIISPKQTIIGKIDNNILYTSSKRQRSIIESWTSAFGITEIKTDNTLINDLQKLDTIHDFSNAKSYMIYHDNSIISSGYKYKRIWERSDK